MPFLSFYPALFPRSTMIVQVRDQDYPVVVWDRFTNMLGQLRDDYVSGSLSGTFSQCLSIFSTEGTQWCNRFCSTGFGAPSKHLLQLVQGQSMRISRDLGDQIKLFLPLIIWQYNVAKRSLIVGQGIPEESNGDAEGIAFQHAVERSQILARSFVTGTAIEA